MANLTLSMPADVSEQMKSYSEIKWSEIARSAILEKIIHLRKLELLRKYVDKEPFSDSDLRWMDENDWHPVDERPMKPEYIKSLKAAMKAPTKKTTIDELFK